ncbi:MAG: hypothetical protein IKB35_01480, partial [Clostridia bacterium]|nr:hypothetical protein [Clostridia bacterium]
KPHIIICDFVFSLPPYVAVGIPISSKKESEVRHSAARYCSAEPSGVPSKSGVFSRLAISPCPAFM